MLWATEICFVFVPSLYHSKDLFSFMRNERNLGISSCVLLNGAAGVGDLLSRVFYGWEIEETFHAEWCWFHLKRMLKQSRQGKNYWVIFSWATCGYNIDFFMMEVQFSLLVSVEKPVFRFLHEHSSSLPIEKEEVRIVELLLHTRLYKTKSSFKNASWNAMPSICDWNTWKNVRETSTLEFFYALQHMLPDDGAPFSYVLLDCEKKSKSCNLIFLRSIFARWAQKEKEDLQNHKYSYWQRPFSFRVNKKIKLPDFQESRLSPRVWNTKPKNKLQLLVQILARNVTTERIMTP